MTIDKLKVQILESVGSLDHVQSKKVLEYIRRMLHSRQDHESYHSFKQRAMKEIQRALNSKTGPQPA